MQCPQCPHENREGATFCDECGARLSTECHACGRENRHGAKFCNACGTSLRPHAPATGPSPHTQRGLEVETPLYTLLRAVLALLRQERRVTYRELKQTFGFDEAFLDNLREELLLKRLAIDEEGKVLVWAVEIQPAAQAETHYQQAFDLAAELGMRRLRYRRYWGRVKTGAAGARRSTQCCCQDARSGGAQYDSHACRYLSLGARVF